jgi:hypothetical protein
VADKTEERIKEQIKYETEVFRAALLITVATIGGTLSMLLGTLTPLRTVLAGAGILVSIVGVVSVVRQDRIIRALIARIEEKTNERL